MNRRTALAAIGTGVAGGAVASNYFDFSLNDIDLGLIPDQPPLSEAEADPSGPHTPWETDTVVVGFKWYRENSRSAFVSQYGMDLLHNAVEFWNNYISENEPYDLTLTFDRHHDNPDIVLEQATIPSEYTPEYKTPGSQNSDYSSQISLETLRETPSERDLPVTGIIGRCGNGRNVYQLIAQHAIGRLIGYEIWSDPVSVMNPKITVATSYDSDAREIYYTPERSFRKMQPDVDDSIENLRNSEDVIPSLENIRDDLDDNARDGEVEMSIWLNSINDKDMTMYADAYEQTIMNNEITYVQDTRIAVRTLLDRPENEIKNATDQHTAIADRIETLSEWGTTITPFDMQLHQYVTDELWSAWAAEQS